ncbi:MAG TPA: hypothetical protein VLS28_00345 [Candidatus Sulfomarinibacteraceae bacterium]|nr:hypothetical protein [Candidatus Sulfomarinibacteraceae bacterium]
MGTQFVVQIENRPGALAEIAERLGVAGVDIHGLLVVGRRGSNVLVAVTVDDDAAAREDLDAVPASA